MLPLMQTGGFASSIPLVSPDGVYFPQDAVWTAAANVNLALASANTGYFVKIHVPYPINFTKATLIQTSGTIANIGVYYGLYDLNGNKITQFKFLTVNPGGAAVSLAATISGALSWPVGGYYWVIAVDTANASAGTVIGGQPTSASYMSLKNVNGCGNAFLASMISGGALVNSFTVGSSTKVTTGHIGSNVVGAVYLEP